MSVPEIPSYRSTFARLLGFLKPYKWSLGVSIILAVGSQAAAVAMAFLTGAALQQAIQSRDHHGLWVIAALVLSVGLARALLMMGRRLISGRQALGVEFDMRNSLYSKLVRLSFGFYDRHQTGQLMSRATVDLQSVRFFLGYGLVFIAQSALTILLAAVAKMRSEPARKRAVSRSSWAKDLTTRTPTTFSSAWVVTSATFCWTSFSTGWLVRE